MKGSTGQTTRPGLLADLRAAVNERDVARVTALLAGIERLDGSFRTVTEKMLEWALFYDHIEIVRAALEKGAPSNTAKGRAPRLAGAHSMAMARLLIAHGADVHATWIPTGNGGRSASVLHYRSSSDDAADLKRYFTELLGLVDEGALARVEPMPEGEFWAIVERALRAGKGDETMQAREIVMEIRRRPVADIVALQRRFDDLVARLRSAELWAFFYLVDGGCSDDVFLFQVPSRVIALGRTVYEAAVADPDSLLPHVEKNKLRYHNYSATRCQRVGDAGEVAFRMLTGRDDFTRLVGAKPASAVSLTWDPRDEAWLAARLPRTWKATRL
jgi:Protein of unknown function (DUF4240)